LKISEQWLREWADPNVDTQGLTEQLTMAGLEVDSVEPCVPSLDGVVVARVLERNPHPDADRLSVCSVDVGEAEPLQVVCGASNVRAGGYYPLATIGATLPGGLKIKRSKIRGQESFGMLCSTSELGMGDAADGLLELDDSFEPGTGIAELLGLDDHVIDLDLTPNRADCFSVLGIARDVAAVNLLDFCEPAVEGVSPEIDDIVAISLDAGAACPVFAGRVIKGIDATAVSPLWMRERLRRSGIRPLYPVVDVSNYVMLEYGQPMHAYDLARLKGAVSARMAGSGEKLSLLGGQEVELTDDVLVIADQDAAVGVAGIMGGASTAVTAATTDVFLESAFFSPEIIAGRARRYGLHTDASLRFERGVDYTGQVRAIERATELLVQIAGGKAGPVTEVRNDKHLPERLPIELRRARLAKVLGVEIPDDDVASMLARLGFDVASTDAGWSVSATSARFDIAIEADLIEEVVRLFGYDQVPVHAQVVPITLSQASESRVSVDRAGELLVDRGYQEAISYSFVDPVRQQQLLGDADEIELLNPLSVDQSVMRRSLWPGLLQAVALNKSRQQTRLRLFESGVIFTSQANEITEEDCLAGIAWGRRLPEQWGAGGESAKPSDLFDIKSDVEALIALTGEAASVDFVAAEHPALRPGMTARVERAGETIGWLGELHPRLVREWDISPAPVMFEMKVQPGLASRAPVFKPVSRFPSARRDLAVLVSEQVSAAELLAEARDAAGPVLREIRVFDVYTGDKIEIGLKSIALGLILQETSRNLTELEIEGAIDAVTERFSSKFNASIRE
jgi:phenylalanyl-tRNA synthetase beta chain